MKTDNSIKNIVVAAIKRKVMNPEEWIYSKVCKNDEVVGFNFEEEELPIFEIMSSNAKTVITTRKIIELIKDEISFITFNEINDVIYGDFKGQINKPELSTFRIIDIYGEEYNFQIETGKASIGLINAVNTVLQLRSGL